VNKISYLVMKFCTSFLTIFISFAVCADLNLYTSSNKDFYLSCKVLDQSIFTVEEGKKKARGSSFKNGLQNGDTFIVMFEFYSARPSNSDVVSSYKFSMDIPSLYIDGSFSSEDIRSKRGLPNVEFLANVIELKDFVHEVRLRRYYKDDWQLLYTSNFYGNDSISLQGHILTANCADMPNEYSEMIKEMSEINNHMGS
tara:strand:- start:3476 stop:4069 length:594 start_codon:yes stop_codon:yes gene_type:complete